MEKDKKNNRDELDEAFVIASFKNKERRNNPSAARQLVPEKTKELEEPEDKQEVYSKQKKAIDEEPQVPREEVKRKRNKSPDYESLFLVDAGIPTRSGKLVSIREKYHKRIAKIVQVLGENEVSIFSYIDNVLSHHFDMFQTEITELYNKNNDDDYLTPKK